MQMYNATTDQLIKDIRPSYSKGFVSHYIAKDVDTGKRVKIAKDELKNNFQDTRYVDVEYLRGDDIGEKAP